MTISHSDIKLSKRHKTLDPMEQVRFTAPISMVGRLHDYCDEHGATISSTLRDAITEYLDRRTNDA